jgi:hypothetical protein
VLPGSDGPEVACEQPATTHWRDLQAELDLWGQSGKTATFWWRDDDASQGCAKLDQLLIASDSVPLSLGVIPAIANKGLAQSICGLSRVAVLQHGWRHWNYSESSEVKSEFCSERPVGLMLSDVGLGLQKLGDLFGSQFCPVFVPPWNRIASQLTECLCHVGVRALSLSGRRKERQSPPGIIRINVHVNIISFKTPPKSFTGTSAAIESICSHLRARRLGVIDAKEPTGILSHHRVQGDDSFEFLTLLRELVLRHGAARWLTIDEALSTGLSDDKPDTMSSIASKCS